MQRSKAVQQRCDTDDDYDCEYDDDGDDDCDGDCDCDDHSSTPVGGGLRAPATVDAADQEDVPAAHVRAPGRAVADANATAREPVAAARDQRLAQQ